MDADTDILLDGLAFPEAPRWRDGRLWFTDQHARRVAWVEPDGHSGTLIETDDLPGGLGWLPDQTPLVVAMTERRLYRIEPSGLQLHADLADLASFHCNDMLVDHRGRAYVGNFGFDLHGGAERRTAELILVEPNGEARVVAERLMFPNGCVLCPDRERLIVAESFGHRLTQFEVRPDGSLGNRRVWADLDQATPDGICLDAAGAVWVASPGTNELLRIVPGGRIDRRVRCHGTPYACMLGGQDGRMLFVLTSETDDPQLAAARCSGRIETLAVAAGHAGLP
jgi:sugar lactone lactonase YvrE